MSDNEQLFRPETVDEQIEHYASEAYDQDAPFDVQFVQTLQHIYHSDVSAEDRASLVRARERIANKKAALPPSSLPAETNVFPLQSKRSAAMQKTLFSNQRKPSTLWRTFNMVAAVLVIGFIVGSWFIATHITKRQGPMTVSTNQAKGYQKNVYLVSDRVAYKLDGQTGKAIWQHQLSPQSQTYTGISGVDVVDGSVYVVIGRDIYALNANDGKERWHVQNTNEYQNAIITHDRIYLHERSANGFSFSARNTKDGSLLWRNTTFLSRVSQAFYLLHGMLYIVMNNNSDLYCLDTTSGVMRWHFKAPPRPSAQYPPVVENGIVYYGVRNNFYALNEKNGQKLWEQQVAAEESFSVAQIVNGLVYVGSSPWGGDDVKSGTLQSMIHAFNGKDGRVLWTSPLGYSMYSSVPITDGMLFASGYRKNVFTVNGIQVRDGTIRWQTSEHCVPNQCASDMIIDNGVGYFFRGDGATSATIRMIDVHTGKLLAQHSTTLPGKIIAVSDGVLYQLSFLNNPFDKKVSTVRLATGSQLWQYTMLHAEGGGDPGGSKLVAIAP
jgi:outer membrane protein assembly factor BamB